MNTESQYHILTEDRLHAQEDRFTNLDERLDLAPLRNLLRTHTLRYLEGVTLDAGNDSMGVWPFLGALVELLDDDHLLPRLAALEDDCDLVHESQLRVPTLFQPAV